MCSGILSQRILDISLFRYILVLGLVLDFTSGDQRKCRRSATRRQESRYIGTAYGENGISNKCVSKIVVGVCVCVFVFVFVLVSVCVCLSVCLQVRKEESA